MSPVGTLSEEARYLYSHLHCLQGLTIDVIALNLESLHLERYLEVEEKYAEHII